MLVVLTVTILARLFGQLGVAVTSHAKDQELRPFVDRALVLALMLGLIGMAAILAAGAIIDSFGLRLAAIAAPALLPNIVMQVSPACFSAERACACGTTSRRCRRC